MVTLYTKQGAKFRTWRCLAEGAEVVVIHGQENGKQTEKRYTAVGKNIGKANETTPERQAQLEVEAKITKQLKSGYFYTKAEAEAYVPFFPMKAQNYLDFAHKITYPCYVQPKLDGQRLMIDKRGNAWSKQGEPLELPKHWTGVRELAIQCEGIDGEIYAGLPSDDGLILQDIISAFRKENDDTHKLQFWVYDRPTEGRFGTRHALLLAMHCRGELPPEVVYVPTYLIHNEKQAEDEFNFFVAQGYEGVVYRNCDGLYEFDKRSYDLIKRKKREDAEARVLSVEPDKNEDGVVYAELVNGEHKGNKFKCLFRKDASPDINLRKYENAIALLGKTFTVEFEAYSDDGVPQKPVGKCLRQVDENGNPVI